MQYTFTPRHLVVLPRLDAAGAIALAQALEAAAQGQRGELEAREQTSILEALDEIAQDRTALAASVSAQASDPGAPPAELKEADRREDTAITVLHDLLATWARLADELPEGRLAEELYHRLFGEDGIACVNLPVEEEWAVIDTKLQIIALEGLRSRLASLGGEPLLRHLQAVHAQYGEAIGGAATPQVEPAVVRQRREALLASIRLYVLRVVGSVDRRHPGSEALADLLLEPIVARRAQAIERALGGADLDPSDDGPPQFDV